MFQGHTTVSDIAGIQTQVFLIPGPTYVLQHSPSTQATLATISLPHVGHVTSYDHVHCLNKVPDFRLNVLVVEFTITSAFSLVISPVAIWKVTAPIFISYVVNPGLEPGLKVPEKKGSK